jgi:lipoprotein-anchoring transpeptidase ErfK/SrfK
MKTSNIRAGDTFKIITGKFSVEVNKFNFTLTLYLNNEFVKEYPVAVGEPKESPTPEGTFHILGSSKNVNPPWHRYDKTTGKTTIIPFGDPAHSIGTRWMGFKDNEKVGIHGTNDPNSIGKAVTNGCVRMHNADVEELFDFIHGGTEVNIHE